MPIRGLVYLDSNELFVGFRSSGQMSLYWNQDPVFQFNLAGQLRRVFYRGSRYAANNGHLCQLVQDLEEPQRNVAKLQFHWRPIAQDALLQIDQSFDRIQETILLCDHLNWNTVGELDDRAFHAKLVEWLVSRPSPLSIAASPNA